MSNVASFVWTSRDEVCDQLAAHLAATAPRPWPAPRGSPHRDNVAIVLARLAPPRLAHVLRTVALDRREAGVVRARSLAGLTRCGAELSPAELAGLCDEPAVSGDDARAELTRVHLRVRHQDVERALGHRVALDPIDTVPPRRAAALLAEWTGGWDGLLPALVARVWPSARRLAHVGCPAVRRAVLDHATRDPDPADASAAWAAAEATEPIELVRAGLRVLEALRVCGPRYDALLGRLERVHDPFVPLLVAMARVRTAGSLEALQLIRAEAMRADMRWGLELALPRIEAIAWLARAGRPDDLPRFARIVARHAGCPCGACVAYPIEAARALAAAGARTDLLCSSLDTASYEVADACGELLST